VPDVTGSGVSTFVTERSADAATVVVAVPLSFPGFPSAVAEVAVAVFVRTVPSVTDGATATVNVNTEFPTANDGFEHDTVPAAPTAGVVHDQPAPAGKETNVVPAGSVSLHDAEDAASGPLFVTVIVYVKLFPAFTGSGVSTLVTARSATSKIAIRAGSWSPAR
jgi:hypothetical protein